jgi:hypothetical protein
VDVFVVLKCIVDHPWMIGVCVAELSIIGLERVAVEFIPSDSFAGRSRYMINLSSFKCYIMILMGCISQIVEV